jgi:hypothetical protein
MKLLAWRRKSTGRERVVAGERKITADSCVAEQVADILPIRF